MGRLIGLLAVALITVLAYAFFFKKSGISETASTTQSTIDATGAKMDILSIAQAERAYQAEHGDYAPLEQLTSSGALTTVKPSRPGYTYEVETFTGGFRVVARCTSPSPCSSYAVDQSMEVQAVP